MPDQSQLTEQQREYNTAETELFNLAVYGHAHRTTEEYITLIRAAQKRFAGAAFATAVLGGARPAVPEPLAYLVTLSWTPRWFATRTVTRNGVYTPAPGLSRLAVEENVLAHVRAETGAPDTAIVLSFSLTPNTPPAGPRGHHG